MFEYKTIDQISDSTKYENDTTAFALEQIDLVDIAYEEWQPLLETTAFGRKSANLRNASTEYIQSAKPTGGEALLKNTQGKTEVVLQKILGFIYLSDAMKGVDVTSEHGLLQLIRNRRRTRIHDWTFWCSPKKVHALV